MKVFIQQLNSFLSFRARFNQLHSSAQIMILLHLFYFLGDYLSNIFVSVYLWKLNHNLIHVVWFYLSETLACFLFSAVAGQSIKRQSPSLGIGIGTMFLALFYFGLLVLQDRAVDHVFLLGFLKGTGIAFYWMSFHFLVLIFTQEQERHLYNGYLEISSAFSSLITPILSGGLIFLLNGHQGYFMIFLISFLFFLTATILSFLIKIPFQLKHSLKIKPVLYDSIHPKKRWFWGMQGNLVQGISDGIFLMLPGVFYFLYVKNEWNLGLLSSFFACITLLSNFLVGHLLTLRYRLWSIFSATLIHAGCITLMFFVPPGLAVLLFGLGHSLVKPWYYIPSISAYYDYIDQKTKKKEHSIEYLIAREWALTIGRGISLCFLLWLSTHISNAQESLQWYTFLVALCLPSIGLAVYRLSSDSSKKD